MATPHITLIKSIWVTYSERTKTPSPFAETPPPHKIKSNQKLYQSVAGHNIKPSDILQAVRNSNSNQNNRYKSANAYPEPATHGPVSSGGQQQQQHPFPLPTPSPGGHQVAVTAAAAAATAAIALSKNSINAAGSGGGSSGGAGNNVAPSPSIPIAMSPVDAATYVTSQLQLQPPQQTSAVPANQSPLSSNIVSSSNNSTNKQVINQSSASRKKNRRIGRHESRYTSGNDFSNFFFLFFFFLVFFLFIIFFFSLNLKSSFHLIEWFDFKFSKVFHFHSNPSILFRMHIFRAIKIFGATFIFIPSWVRHCYLFFRIILLFSI